MAKANFEIVKKNDKRKNAWAKKNGYKLIRIPFSKAAQGRFVRKASQFRNWITSDSEPGPRGVGGFKS